MISHSLCLDVSSGIFTSLVQEREREREKRPSYYLTKDIGKAFVIVTTCYRKCTGRVMLSDRIGYRRCSQHVAAAMVKHNVRIDCYRGAIGN